MLLVEPVDALPVLIRTGVLAEMSLHQHVVALLALPVLEEAVIEIVFLGLLLFLNIPKKLEGVRFVSSLFHLPEHLGVIDLP